MTLAAGFHYDIPTHEYHADPCPEPSLTQSIAKLILPPNGSPAHARHAHPRLNQLWSPDDATKYDIGNIAHKLILGRGREIEVLDFDDWRTKDARAARENAGDRHRLAVLEKDQWIASSMVEMAYRQLCDGMPYGRGYAADWDTDDTDPPRAEVVVIAETAVVINEWTADANIRTWKEHPIYLRAMIDWLATPTRVWDYKTTHMPAARSIATSLPDWCIQAAMHERILNLIDPDNAGRREHRFVVQEDFEPYALQVVRLTEAHMTVGRAQIARAEALWAQCMATGEWPAYPIEDQTPEYPAWKLAQIMESGDVTD